MDILLTPQDIRHPTCNECSGLWGVSLGTRCWSSDRHGQLAVFFLFLLSVCRLPLPSILLIQGSCCMSVLHTASLASRSRGTHALITLVHTDKVVLALYALHQQLSEGVSRAHMAIALPSASRSLEVSPLVRMRQGIASRCLGSAARDLSGNRLIVEKRWQCPNANARSTCNQPHEREWVWASHPSCGYIKMVGVL